MLKLIPSFISKPAPLAEAVDAIERGIERRSARMELREQGTVSS